MEGRSIRKLMMLGPVVFAEIAKYLKDSMQPELSRDKGMASNKEITTVCTAYGRVYLLLDSCFSFIYRIRNRPATETEKQTLEDRIEVLKVQWEEIGLSITPKMHLMLNHVLKQIGTINGYGSMCEDHIERNH